MKVSWIMSACVVLALLVGAQSVLGDGWSLPGTSSGSSKTSTSKTKKKEPGPLEKLGSGAKKLVTGVTDTLTGKKKATAKKKTNPPWMGGSKATQPEKKSWLTSMLAPKQPEGPKTPSDWIAGERPDF